jgi:hypothetical protein
VRNAAPFPYQNVAHTKHVLRVRYLVIYLPGCHCRRLAAPVRLNVPPIIEVYLGFRVRKYVRYILQINRCSVTNRNRIWFEKEICISHDSMSGKGGNCLLSLMLFFGGMFFEITHGT